MSTPPPYEPPHQPPGPPPYQQPPGPPPYEPFPVAPAPGGEVAEDGGPAWHRLDKRLLVIGPLAVLRQFAIPLVIGFLGIGGSGGGLWSLLLLPVALVAAAVLGAIPWLTTYYRQTPTQFEVRRGLLNKTNLTAPLDRVRSVDLTAPLVHRLLGVTKVEIGTGVDDTRIELETLSREAAAHLRTSLLHRAHAAGAPQPTAGGEPAPYAPAGTDLGEPGRPGADLPPAGAPGPTVELATMRWSWLRFAPLSLARLAIVAGALGASSQFLDDLPFFDTEHARSVWGWVESQALALVLAGGALILLVAWLLLSITGYVLQWFNYRLVRQPGGQKPGDTSLRLTAGLLTTRSTTVEDRRVRGIEIVEPALMRLADGAELSTLATGVEDGTTKILPSCPTSVAVDVAHRVLGPAAEASRPLAATLASHGGAARRRAHVRWQWLTLVAGTAGVVATIALDGPWAPPVAGIVALALLGVAGAEASYRNLGHALTTDDDGPLHLVAGSGAFARHRTVLEVDGVIGWVISQTFFQRRRGLANLVATTAAGSESVLVRDVPLALAVPLADATTPGLLTSFLPGR